MLRALVADLADLWRMARAQVEQGRASKTGRSDILAEIEVWEISDTEVIFDLDPNFGLEEGWEWVDNDED